jgi:hypothetical protein
MITVVFCASKWHVDVVCSSLIDVKGDSQFFLVRNVQSDTKTTKMRIPDYELYSRFAVIGIRPEIIDYETFLQIIPFRKVRLFWPGGINWFLLKDVIRSFAWTSFVAYDEGTSSYYPRGYKGVKGLIARRKRRDILFESASSLLFSLGIVKKYFLFSYDGINEEVKIKLLRYYELRSVSKNIDMHVILALDYDNLFKKNDIFRLYRCLVLECERRFKMPVIVCFHPNSCWARDFSNRFRELNVLVNEDGRSAEDLTLSNRDNILVYGISTVGVVISAIGTNRAFSFLRAYENVLNLDDGYSTRIDMFDRTFSKKGVINYL